MLWAEVYVEITDDTVFFQIGEVKYQVITTGWGDELKAALKRLPNYPI